MQGMVVKQKLYHPVKILIFTIIFGIVLIENNKNFLQEKKIVGIPQMFIW
jgi:hypothetical protein